MDYIDKTAIVRDSTTDGASVFKEAFVNKCKLSANCTIGDFTRIENSQLEDNVALQRNNLVYSTFIGRHTYTGRNCTIWNATIGRFCSISWNVSIGGGEHDYKRLTTHSFLYAKNQGLIDGEPYYDRLRRPCQIGHDVWLGCNSVVCRGVSVGDGAVVGAGSVVTHDVAPYTIVAGSPAKVIKKRFAEEIIEALLDLEWWELDDDTIRRNSALFASEPDESLIVLLQEIKKRR